MSSPQQKPSEESCIELDVLPDYKTGSQPDMPSSKKDVPLLMKCIVILLFTIPCDCGSYSELHSKLTLVCAFHFASQGVTWRKLILMDTHEVLNGGLTLFNFLSTRLVEWCNFLLELPSPLLGSDRLVSRLLISEHSPRPLTWNKKIIESLKNKTCTC